MYYSLLRDYDLVINQKVFVASYFAQEKEGTNLHISKNRGFIAKKIVEKFLNLTYFKTAIGIIHGKAKFIQ